MATNSYINYSLFHIENMPERYPTPPQVVDPFEKTLSEVKCHTCELETKISCLGEIVELPVSVPRFATFHTSIVATGKEGRAPGGLFAPSGVAIHEETHQIFIVNYLNDRVEMFSETGEFLSQLGVGQLSHPYVEKEWRCLKLCSSVWIL